MGGGSGGPSQTSTSTTSSSSVSNPWSGIQRNLVEATGLARGLANQPYSQFPYSWQTGMPLLNTARQYQVYGITGLQGMMNQPDYNEGIKTLYQGPGTQPQFFYGGNIDPMAGDTFTWGGSPYGGSPYGGSYSYGGGVPVTPVGADPYSMALTGGGGYGYGGYGGGYATGNYGGGLTPYNVAPSQGYNNYPIGGDVRNPMLGVEKVGQGTMEGYYQNFATGQTMPYSNYLPYVSEVAPLNSLQNLGLQQTAAIAAAGDPLAGSATQMLSDTMTGKYLYPQSNPFLQSTYQAAAGPTMQNYLNAVYPGLRSSASQAGQFGSSSDALLQGQAQYNLGKTLSDLGTGIYGQNYQAERANQLKGALEAPAISAEAFTYPQALVGAGTIYQQQAQQNLSDMVQQYNQAVNYPWTMLQNYAATIGGMPVQGYGDVTSSGGAVQKGINPYYVSPASSALGSASALAGMGTSLAGIISMFL